MDQPMNRIQYYRKKMNISQEELGEKMYVSRQTVSQWETGQTMPSIDSLIKLRTIFGVTVDALLGVTPLEEEAPEKDAAEDAAPIEDVISYHFDEMEAEKVLLLSNKGPRKVMWMMLLCSAIFFILTVVLKESQGKLLMAIPCGGTLFCSLILVFTQSKWKNTYKASAAAIAKRTFHISDLDGKLHFQMYSGVERVSDELRDYTDIRSSADLGEYYSVDVAGRLCFLRKTDFGPDTEIVKHIQASRAQRPMQSERTRKYRLLSILVCIASISCLWGGLLLSAKLTYASGDYLNFNKNFWGFFVLLPIPIFSIVLGFLLKKEGAKYMKNIVIGVLVSILLILFGSVSFSTMDANQAVAKVQEEMQIELPSVSHISYTTMSSDRGYMKGLSEAKMVCTLDGGIAFVNALDERWRSYFDKSLTPYVAPRAHEYDADACLFYNASTGEYNKPPTEAGRYDIILLCFSRVENTLYILEYTLTV